MKRIKVLSLWQPWATLVVAGLKGCETRSWLLHTGRIGIHAAQRFDRECRALCRTEPFQSLLAGAGFKGEFAADQLPRGGIIGSVFGGTRYRVRSSTSMNQVDSSDCVPLPGWPERELGDYRTGRCVQELSDPRACTLIKIPGRQRYFWAEVPDWLVN